MISKEIQVQIWGFAETEEPRPETVKGIMFSMLESAQSIGDSQLLERTVEILGEVVHRMRDSVEREIVETTVASLGIAGQLHRQRIGMTELNKKGAVWVPPSTERYGDCYYQFPDGSRGEFRHTWDGESHDYLLFFARPDRDVLQKSS